MHEVDQACSIDRAAVSRAVVTGLLVIIVVSCTPDPSANGIDRALAQTIREIEAGRATTPLVEQPIPGSEATVTFLVKGTGDEVPRIVSDVTGWGVRPDDETFDLTVGAMTRVGTSDWYRLQTHVAPRTRIEYLVVHGQTDYRVDPNNPRRAELHTTDPVSEMVTPDYVPPRALTEPHVTPRGRTVEGTIQSRALDGSRRVIVYLPPGYRDDGAYPVAVFHSGWERVRAGELPRVLDWLIGHRFIEPIIVAFLQSYLPGDPDNHEGPPMRSFLAREAPEWLAERYGIARQPAARAILAVSYGAKDALDAAATPGSTYGCLGLMIPGRRLTPADLTNFAEWPSRRLRVAIVAGRYDRENLATAQNAYQALTDAGHDVDFMEVPEGHNRATWRNHFGDVLVSLFGERNERTTLPILGARPDTLDTSGLRDSLPLATVKTVGPGTLDVS